VQREALLVEVCHRHIDTHNSTGKPESRCNRPSFSRK
jgi:hypothetical protein